MSSTDDPHDDGEQSSLDAVIACYERDVDRTLIRDRLRLTPAERIRDLQVLYDFAAKLRGTAHPSTPAKR